MRIAIEGDHTLFPTGYGGQNRQLLTHLKARGHEVACFAIQHAVKPLEVEGITTYSGFDTHAVRRSLHDFRPDVLIHNLDNWALISGQRTHRPMLPAVAAHREQDGGTTALIHYSPVDTDAYPPAFVEAFKEADLALTTTKWGRDVQVRLGCPAEQIRVLYPGVDPELFTPEGSASLKPFDLPEDKPLVTCIGTNLGERKMFPLVMLAFKSYLEHYDKEAVLYLHTPEGHYKLEEFVKPLGIEGKMYARDARGPISGAWGNTDAEMAQLYRASACLLSMSNREGFDSPAAEAASCGTPVVLSDFPVRRELQALGKGYWRYLTTPSKQWFPIQYAMVWLADPDQAADTMAKAVRARGKGGVPERLKWKNLAGELEGYCETACERYAEKAPKA